MHALTLSRGGAKQAHDGGGQGEEELHLAAFRKGLMLIRRLLCLLKENGAAKNPGRECFE